MDNWWFPSTKLQPPHLSAEPCRREALLQRLAAAATTRRLILLSAPAGSGKTTLLASLPRIHRDIPIAWLSLDDDDNNPSFFFSGLLKALCQLHPTFGAHTSILLQNSAHPEQDLRRITSMLINEIIELDPPSFLLALDDLHHIYEPAIFSALDYLLEHMPPAMHLAVTTRYDPPLALARLRARDQLAEFRLDDLRFSIDEMNRWLNQQRGLTLLPEQLTELHQRTEGWAAGIHLLSLKLEQIDRSGHRHIFLQHLGDAQHYIFDFLAEEVLTQIDAQTRTFLLETSILAELTPALCQAVTGLADAAALLERLYRGNLFLLTSQSATVSTWPHPERSPHSPADSPVYRYHALFAQYLQRILRQEAAESHVRELYRRAAEAETLPIRAIHYLLAASQWNDAAELLEQVGRQLLKEGYTSGLRRLIEELPQSIRDQRPWLILLLGADAAHRGHYEMSRPILEQALHRFESINDPLGEGEALVELGEVYTCLAQVQPALPVLQRSLGYTIPLHRKIKSTVNLSWIAYYQQDWPQCEAYLEAILADVGASGDHKAYYSIISSLGPHAVFGNIGMAPIEALCRRALTLFGDDLSPIAAGSLAYLGYIELLQGNIEQACAIASRARAFCNQLGDFAHLHLFIDHVHLTSALIQGDYTRFDEEFSAILPRIEQVLTYRQWLVCYRYLAGRAALLQGDLDKARYIYRQMMTHEEPYDLPEIHVAAPLMAGLGALAEERFAHAEEHLRDAVARQRHTRNTLLITNAQLSLAQLYLAWQRPNDALPLLDQTLAEMAQRAMPGILLQEGPVIIPILKRRDIHALQPTLIDSALAIFQRDSTTSPLSPSAQPQPLPTAQLTEALSPREIEVLRLLAHGLSNADIARRLVVAAATVKRHTINIYGKLGVGNRTAAVTRARELGLLK
ncbi:MAG: hypothetical protein HXY39_04425 [Chloroflexi bacterium]|nr:hypothetical protein [Chloroflexota bacterium]